MHFSVPLLALTAFFNISLGLLVFSRSPSKLTSQAFGAMAVSISLWSLGLIGYYSLGSEQSIAFAVNSFYIFALFMNASLLVFTGAFLEQKNRVVYLYFPIVTSLMMAFGIVFVDQLLVVVGGLQEFGADIMLKPVAYAFYTALVIGYYLITVGTFIKHRNQGDYLKRQQIKLITIGLVIAGVFASYFNVLLPWLDNYSYVWSGPLFTLIFVGLISFSILKHKLFDIRAAISRTLAYLGSIISVLAIYLAAIVALSGVNLLSSDLTNFQRVSYATIAVLSGLLFPVFKNFYLLARYFIVTLMTLRL